MTQQFANLLYLGASTLFAVWVLCAALALSLLFHGRRERIAATAFTVVVFVTVLVVGLVWRARGGL